MLTMTEQHKQTIAAFFLDFWKLIKASYEIPQEPQENAKYWHTLIMWYDALMKKYNGNPTVCWMVISYIDGQTDRQQAAAGSNCNK